MAGNTYNNNSRNNDSTNSQGKQYYNSDGLIQSTLEIAYWNKMISLKISPALEASKRTQSERFDYNKTLSMAVATEKARMFAEIALADVLKALDAGETMQAKGVAIGLDSALIAGVRSHGEEVYPFLGIMKKIDPSTRVPEEMQLYQFSKVIMVDSYDFENGVMEPSYNTAGEVYDLQQVLITAANDLVGAGAHATKHNDRFFRAKLIGGGNNDSAAPYSSTNNVFSGASNKPAGPESPIDKTTLTNASSLNDFTDM